LLSDYRLLLIKRQNSTFSFIRNNKGAIWRKRDAVLENFGADRIIVGHTPTGGVVKPRFGGRVVLIDVGIGNHYGGNRGYLLFEDGRWYGVHWGEKIPLPGEDPAALFDYLETVSALGSADR